MEEAPENGKELSLSAHAKGMNEKIKPKSLGALFFSAGGRLWPKGNVFDMSAVGCPLNLL